jgi:hypothetical protein
VIVLHLLMWMLAVGLLLVGISVLTIRWAWRRARRAVTRRLRAVGAGVNPAGVVWLRAASPGAGRAVAIVRRDLRRDVTGAVRAVDVGRQAGRPVEALGAIARRLDEQATVLDVDLAVLAAEPDPRTRRRLLAAQESRISLLRKACGEVRRGVLLAGTITTAPLLASMVDDLNDEIILLGLQARAYAELTQP